MKFGKYFRRNKIDELDEYYVDYKKLKKILKNNDSKKFYDLINFEINKLNKFINKNKNYKNKIVLSNFLILNYMAIFKSIKKHDKKLSKNTKIQFFENISKTSFYKYYLNLPRECKKIKLVIFDKDGTLINHENIFGKWIVKLVENLSNIVKNKNKLYEFLGYDKDSDSFEFNSIVARGTNDDIRNSIFKFIINENNNNNIKNDYLKNEIKKKWIPLTFDKSDLIQCANIKKLFKFLKSKNIKIAVCTSDDREPTEKTLSLLNLNDFVDEVMCGDDPFSSKPSPEPIWRICSNLDIKVENTIMIGDTISDIHAGINAKCGKVIGVLSGSYDNVDLSDADEIINSIDNLVDII